MKRLSNVHMLAVAPDLGITPAHINGLAESYSKSSQRAPVVIGHPTTDGPAYGWVVKLIAKDENLYGDLDLTEKFYDVVRNGFYKERSVAFYNKEPYKLRHLGFLGATPPAIKGLQDLTFDDSDTEYKCIAMTTEQSTDLTPFILPVTYLALSEVLPELQAKNMTQEPSVDADGNLSGLVELSDGRKYKYNVENQQGQWRASTELVNPEVVTLAEKVASLEKQLLVNEFTNKVNQVYDAGKLTEDILSKNKCMQLVTCSESDIVWELLNNLPELVQQSANLESDNVELSENSLDNEVILKAQEMGLNPKNLNDYMKAFLALS